MPIDYVTMSKQMGYDYDMIIDAFLYMSFIFETVKTDGDEYKKTL